MWVLADSDGVGRSSGTDADLCDRLLQWPVSTLQQMMQDESNYPLPVFSMRPISISFKLNTRKR